MASVLRHASGSCCFVSPAIIIIIFLLLCSRSITGREVIDAPLPQQNFVPSLSPPPQLQPPPPPPGPITTAKSPRCDQTFVSVHGGPQNGTFNAPILINAKGESQQCVYTFLAASNQRVEIIFTTFGLRGTPPECVHEYMDIYTQIRSENATKLIESPFGGRYCGPIPPRKRISFFQGIALSFFTDKNTTGENLFSGKYAFINASEFEVGTPAPNAPCSFMINSTLKRTGNILTPTYPGTYPKNLVCTYKFYGEPRQRVRIEFRDFDLFFGGPHCPFDYVKVLDGLDEKSPVIGTYCGQQRNLVLYSSQSNLTVLFVTLKRSANTQNRGFKGIFEFSESFVQLDFINKSGGTHIRGSECDQKILSQKESWGHVVSPNYPYPYIPKVVCRYFIYGMQDSQNLERVKLEFSAFEISKIEGKGESSSCTDGYLKIYLKGQEATDSYDKFDYEMCGNESNPSHVMSDGPRLVMVFSSGELKQGKGFKAKYTFETEYMIPGTASPDGTCTFTYRSSSKKKGDFNSPRYPSNYPSDTNCTYLFLSTPNEQVTIVFDHFKVRTRNTNITSGHYGSELCQDDWLEIYNMYHDGTETLIGRYCSMTAPGPVESNLGALGLKVILHSDLQHVYSGFKAHYTFDVAKSIFGDCGTNISSLDYGVITSPNFPNKYPGPPKHMASKTCNWFISVRPNHKILLNFEMFSVEGEQSARGCPAAVLRMWISPTSDPIELCGAKAPEISWSHLSDDNNMRLSFISSDKAVGQLGFRAVWTEVSMTNECEPDEYHCDNSRYCISANLRCNKIDNCGPEDLSDEENCVIVVQSQSYAVPAACAAAAVTIALALCMLCHRKLKRRAQEVHIDDLQQQVEDVRYCYHHHHSLLQHATDIHSTYAAHHAHTHNYNNDINQQHQQQQQQEHQHQHQHHHHQHQHQHQHVFNLEEANQPSPPSDDDDSDVDEHVCAEETSSPETP
ncbi:dorsal-ventral patterning tolloid-like protein 1 isoform X2 [Aphidius gifuensis]|uniref:dorsal-ventral patterning tolloid-like protein 1 isoform X2 n=1 Tax=Aphidius gifuensis TaxID=684658 RepID=UPI001CDD4DE4|nr:dorsal-ventral patterning tolloid-like protein 1 isoform X2 [Aphidius gifuensis]